MLRVQSLYDDECNCFGRLVVQIVSPKFPLQNSGAHGITEDEQLRTQICQELVLCLTTKVQCCAREYGKDST